MALTSCIAISALLLAGCASPPASTLLGDSGSSVPTTEITATTPRDVIGVWWLGLPVLTVKGKANLRIVGVRFAHFPTTGVSSPEFFWSSFDPGDNGAITLFDDVQFHQSGHHTDGPYVGTVLRPGAATGYGVGKITINEPGTYRISDVIVRYAEPDGSTRAQTFHINYVFKPKGGS